ncbi:MAG TPA: hypothetical protein PL066_00775, partial [bacterium]|nr:hypothetical protein [bacterium]
VAISGKTIDARNARRMADISAVRTALAIHCAESVTTTLSIGVAAARPLVYNTVATEDMVFTNVKDPDSTGTACAGTADTKCEYSYNNPSDGAVFSPDTTTIDACDYYIRFFLEGKTDGRSYATEAGLIPGA